MTQKTDKKAIFSLNLGHFMADLYSSALAPLYPYVAGKLEISLALISMIISFAHMISSTLQPIFGFYADKTVHRIFMFWGLVFGGLFIPLAIFAKNPILFGVFLMCAIIGNAMFHPQVTAMVAIFNYNNPTLNKYLGIFLAVGIVGYSLGPVFSSNLIEFFGINSLWTIAVLGVISAFILYFTVPKLSKSIVNTSDENIFEVIKIVWKNKALMALLLISVTKSMVSVSFGTYMPFLLEKMGYSINIIGFVLTVFFFFSGVASVVSNKIERYVGAKNVIRISFYGMLPLAILILLTMEKWPIFALVVFGILGFFTFLSVSINLVLAQKILPQYKAVASGFVGGFSWALAALTLSPLGFVAQGISIPAVFITVTTIALFVGIFGFNKELNGYFEKYKNREL